MLTPGSFTTEVVPGDGSVGRRGRALTPAQAPGLDLQYGDHVRVVVTPAQGEELPAGAPLVNDATVVGVHVSDETGQTVVDLLVPQADAACSRRASPPATSLSSWTRGSADGVVALASASGSPGVTTTALGMALLWPRPVLLVEADPTGGSGLLAGYFRGHARVRLGADRAGADREQPQ